MSVIYAICSLILMIHYTISEFKDIMNFIQRQEFKNETQLTVIQYLGLWEVLRVKFEKMTKDLTIMRETINPSKGFQNITKKQAILYGKEILTLLENQNPKPAIYDIFLIANMIAKAAISEQVDAEIKHLKDMEYTKFQNELK